MVHPIHREKWWDEAVIPFARDFRRACDDAGDILLMYGADADGFASSYFAHRALASCAHDAGRIETRAVWNFDYDFEWLPRLVDEFGPALVICFDIPLIRETEIVKAISAQAPLAIYDHHVVPSDVPITLSNVTFVNSRVLGSISCNYPASAFSAAFAAEFGRPNRAADLAVLATGLIGDRADRRNRALFENLHATFPQLESDLLFVFTRQIDALFRVHVHHTPRDAEVILAQLLDSGEPEGALTRFAARFHLADALCEVQDEIETSTGALESRGHDDLLCSILDLKTFSVGAIASRLAGRDVADVVALGFPIGDRVAFELRTGTNGPDLTRILNIQAEQFVPLSAGGHPNAAGALISNKDSDEFVRTLEDALDRYSPSAT